MENPGKETSDSNFSELQKIEGKLRKIEGTKHRETVFLRFYQTVQKLELYRSWKTFLILNYMARLMKA